MLIYLRYWKSFLDPTDYWLLKKGFCCLGFAMDRVALAYLSTSTSIFPVDIILTMPDN